MPAGGGWAHCRGRTKCRSSAAGHIHRRMTCSSQCSNAQPLCYHSTWNDSRKDGRDRQGRRRWAAALGGSTGQWRRQHPATTMPSAASGWPGLPRHLCFSPHVQQPHSAGEREFIRQERAAGGAGQRQLPSTGAPLSCCPQPYCTAAQCQQPSQASTASAGLVAGTAHQGTVGGRRASTKGPDR